MILLMAVLLLLTAAAGGASVRSIRSDGYGPRPTRGDRFTDPRRHL